MVIKTCFHWGNIAKTLSLAAIATVLIYVMFGYFEVPHIIAAIIGIVTGATTVEIGTSIWEPWHFETRERRNF